MSEADAIDTFIESVEDDPEEIVTHLKKLAEAW